MDSHWRAVRRDLDASKRAPGNLDPEKRMLGPTPMVVLRVGSTSPDVWSIQSTRRQHVAMPCFLYSTRPAPDLDIQECVCVELLIYLSSLTALFTFLCVSYLTSLTRLPYRLPHELPYRLPLYVLNWASASPMECPESFRMCTAAI